MYEGLFEANAAVTSSLDLDEVLNLVMTKAAELLNTEAASIFLIDGKTDELALEASTNLPPDFKGKIRFPKGWGVAGWVAENGEPVLTDDISADPRFYSGVQEQADFHTSSYLCVPLKIQDRIIGTAQVLNKKGKGAFDETDIQLMEGFARQAAIALENARLHREEMEKRRLEEELSVARQIQQLLLPKENPAIDGYRIAGMSIPCRWIGGDYYDFIRLPDGCMSVVIADVSGKGIPAAVTMSTTQAALRSLSELNQSIAETVRILNKYLYLNSADNIFVTGFYGVLNTAANSFEYINCGHNPPYLFKKSGEVITLAAGGLILGIMESADYTLRRVELEVGDVLLLFTDGVTESESGNDEMYGEARLIKLVETRRNLSAQEIIEAVHRDVVDYARLGQLEDDLTIVCVKRVE